MPDRAGQITQLAFDLLPASYLFRKGRRLRIDLAGVDKDHFDPPAGPPPTMQLHRGGAFLSRTFLPVVSRR